MGSALLAAEEHANELALEPIWFGVIAFGILLALLLITMSFNRDR